MHSMINLVMQHLMAAAEATAVVLVALAAIWETSLEISLETYLAADEAEEMTVL